MDLSNIDYKLLKALDAVVSEQSFERAAQRLFITQSAVSQRIKLLEKLFGEPLLIRSTPPQSSELGRLLLGHYQRVLQLETELNQQLDLKSNQSQTLPLAVNADSLASWLITALSPLLQQKNVQLNLFVQDESTTWERMRSGEALACLSSKEKAISGSDSHFLGYMEYICVASPDFIERFFKQGVNKESLKHAPAMSFDQHDDMHLAFLREHFQLEMGQYPCHTIRSSEAFVDLTLASGAYSFNTEFSVREHLRNGRLIDILPEHKVRVPLYWHCWQLGGELMQELSMQVINYARQVLETVN
ncbi:LysR family transcriptional regulator ArgP [Psychromonas algicola]|uniref:LysR family transcriptional regulator ArgP n=1 Tax=Psychromonas algicola TaxID=2555642 RepID=UPI001067D8FD|nr:LysR family transcriptional regulator ArgP [Psychromonas sp. RZ5]TEW49256.1 LysR family transcriptional regulator ArgP [Psychromonas sp. RZ5]